jgi:DUF1680 family protein
MYMKSILLIISLSTFCNCTQQIDTVPKTHFPKNIKIAGELAERVELTSKRLQNHPYEIDFIIQDVARADGKLRRFEEYEGDISGRTLGAWSYISRLLGEKPEKLELIAEDVLKYQNKDGYFGKNQMEDGFDYWGRQNFGHGRLLVGLVEYYRLSGDKKVLEAAEKLGDYFTNTIPLWTTKYDENPWKKTGKVDWGDSKSNRLHFIKTHQTSIIEGLVLLYEESHNPKYLETAETVVPLFPNFGQFHSHSYLNTMVGIAMLYEKTGKPQYRQLLESCYWQQVMRYGFRPDGSVCEWFPTDHRTEGCSLTDLLRLHLHMWRITKEAVYLDEAERVWRNGLYFHQTSNGAFGHAVLSSAGYQSDYSEAWWCCLMHGLFAYSEIVNYTAAVSQNNLWINYFIPFQGELDIRTNIVDLEIQTDYPATGKVEITLTPSKTEDFSVKIRIPDWLSNFEVQVNQQEVSGTIKDGFLTLFRTWESGDKISLNFPIDLRVEDEYGNNLLEKRQQYEDPQIAYFFHGPLILGISSKFNKIIPNLILYHPKDRYRAKIESENNSFSIPEAHYIVPAIFEKKNIQIFLSPISEQTGYGHWTDSLENFLRNSEKPIQREPVQVHHRIQIVQDKH